MDKTRFIHRINTPLKEFAHTIADPNFNSYNKLISVGGNEGEGSSSK